MHLPDRPSWNCVACERPWPCGPAREHLASTMTPTRLAAYAVAQMGAAAADLPGVPPAKLHRRFLGWMRVAEKRSDARPKGA
jgi:hypothetical protein